MGSENGQSQLQIDVTNEVAFKTGVVQILQLVADRTACLPDLKRKVEKHEQIVKTAKYVSIPALALFQITIKSILHKLGWG